MSDLPCMFGWIYTLLLSSPVFSVRKDMMLWLDGFPVQAPYPEVTAC